jgi:hypothetical protein
MSILDAIILGCLLLKTGSMSSLNTCQTVVYAAGSVSTITVRGPGILLGVPIRLDTCEPRSTRSCI